MEGRRHVERVAREALQVILPKPDYDTDEEGVFS